MFLILIGIIIVILSGGAILTMAFSDTILGIIFIVLIIHFLFKRK